MTSVKTNQSAAKQLLVTLLEDESLHDLTLEGSDGVQVTACRSVLVGANDVFRSMLQGSFKEGSTKSVKIDYEGFVLKDIVRHLHTVPVSLLGNSDSEDLGEDEQVKSMSQLIKLHEAAEYFNISDLRVQTANKVKSMISSKPALSLSVLQESPLAPEEIVELAWANIRNNKSNILAHDAVQSLPHSILESILADRQILVEEFVLFKMLEKWSNRDGSRMAQAKETCKKYIDLKRIEPGQLPEVAKSGLVSVEQQLEAYKAFALSTSSEQRDVVLPPRKRRRCVNDEFFPYSEVPAKIIVEGAGSAEVNGAYCRAGETKVRFIKQGNGSRFVIEFFDGQWDLVDDDGNVYYEATFDTRKDLPPKTGWATADSVGKAPAPSLLVYLY